MWDVSDVLEEGHRAAGLSLEEQDDDLVMLVRNGHVLGVFMQGVPRARILAEADYWLQRLNGKDKLR